MAKKKLTDAEIKKALECCSGNDDCYHCPMGHHTTGRYNENCGIDLMKLALDLIDRKDAEIEQLEKDKKGLACSFANAVGQKMTAKSEARKEFAEKLKKRLSWHYTTSLWKAFCDFIDRILKETEDEEKLK